MPRFIKKVNRGYVVEDVKGKKYSKKPLSYKKALAQERAIYLSEHGLSNKQHYGGNQFAIYYPQQQVLQNLIALSNADKNKVFGQIYNTNYYNDVATARIDFQKSRPRFGGHLYYSNI
jgi:hypothetical protein